MSAAHTNTTRRALTAFLLAVAGRGLANGVVPGFAAGANFPVFDALLHHGKPNLTRQGLVPMTAVAGVWRPGMPKGIVDEPGVMAALEQLPGEAQVIFIDIEDWPLSDSDGNVQSHNVENYLRTAEIVRRAKPHLQFGFYGIAPACVYWPIIRQDKKQLADWRAVNRALRPLTQWVDFMLPSLYTFYDDHAGWRQFAVATLAEARQYAKPVYPFLMYEYVDRNVLLRGQQVKDLDWSDELAVCRECADGVVLWGGSQRNWSESAPWWQTTLKFMRNNLAPATSPTGRV
jgi:hypothetical protein